MENLKIGDKVYVPKGNAGRGITGYITNIIEGSAPLYFIDDYTEPVFEYELSLVEERDKYTYLQIEEYVKKWVKGNTNQRLGQWFYNNYDNSGEPFPELFYESSIKKALDLIYENYLVQ